MALDLTQWLPMPPNQGPPLPQLLKIYWPWYKATTPPSEAGIHIQVYDAAGNLVGSLGNGMANLAALNLVEGADYTVKVSVTNTSTRAGLPSSANLTVHAFGTAGSNTLLADVPETASFAPGEARSFNYQMHVPIGSGGQTGSLTATVNDPNNASLATGTLAVNITAQAIQYGATISIQ